MPKPIVSDIYTYARARLRDKGGPTSNAWGDADLLAHYQAAYRKLFDAMSFGANVIRREWYFVLPAYTSVLDPFAYDIVDMAEPETMEERNLAGFLNGFTFQPATTPNQITFGAPHGLANNADVIIQDVPVTAIAAIGRWYITYVDALNIQLNGSTIPVSGTGGLLSWGTDKFTTVNPIDRLSDRDITDRLLDYTWEEEKFKFRGANTQRQLHVQYIASGNPPTIPTTVLGIDNCLNFLGTATAGYAAESVGWYQHADRYLVEAFGPKREADGSAGMLRDIINPMVLKNQRQVKTMGVFRKPRNWMSQPWY